MNDQKELACDALQLVMTPYASLSAVSRQALQPYRTLKQVERFQLLYRTGEVPTTFAFVLYLGLFRKSAITS